MAIDPTRQLPGAAVTANEALFDALVRHQIHLLRMVGSVRNDIFKLLNATEADIVARINSSNVGGGELSPFKLRRAASLVETIRRIRNEAWDEVDAVLTPTMKDLAVSEAAFINTAIKTAAPVVLDTTLPAIPTLKALVTTSPFEGRVMSSWARKLRVDDLARIEGQIQIGVVQGEATPKIARRIVGTKFAKGRDGITQLTRRQAEGVVRTATIHYSNQARNSFFLENKDIVEVEQYVATLDARTTLICKSLDGQRFDVGVGRFPPVHWRCRSLRVAVLNGELMSMRPMKASTEQMMLREFSARRGLGKVLRRADLPRGTKGAFDEFSRKRVRELTGLVPAKVTYQKWLETQAASFQDDTLGPTRGVLFRKGGLTLKKFVNRRGDELTLKQLAQRDGEAFLAAGLDPVNFL